MKNKILKNWLVVLVFFPYLLPKILEHIDMDLKTQTICSLVLFCCFLANGWYEAEKRNNILPKPDISTLKRIFDTFDFDSFNQNITSVNSWYGYDQKEIYKLLDFRNLTNLPTNQIAMERVSVRLDKILNAIDDFTEYSSKNMFIEKDRYILLKESEKQYKQSQKHAEIINEKAKIISLLLLDFRKYLIKKDKIDIFELNKK